MYLHLWRVVQLRAVVQLLLMLIVCYALLRVTQVCFKVFGQLYVLWVIAFGGKASFSNVNRCVRLHLYMIKSSQLDKVTISELYHFTSGMIEKTDDITIEVFHKILLQYTYVALFRDKTDGSLRGMTLIGIDREVVEGRNYTIIKLGLILFKNAYHGGPLIILLMVYHLMKELILHPFTPLFVIGKSFSYKSYLIMVNNYQTFYPRYDKETPVWEQSIIDKFGRSFETMTDTYDPTTSVITREKSKLKEHVAFISEEDLKNPHIRYFIHRNPGWNKGHCLVVMGRLSWSDIVRAIKKTAKRYLYGVKAGSSKVKHDSRGLLEASLDERRNTLDHIKTYESTLCEVDPWSKMEVHHTNRNVHNRNYMRTESVSQLRSDSWTSLPTI